LDRAGIRLDRFLAESVNERSRSFWQRAILDGQVRVNGRTVLPKAVVKFGDQIEFVDLDDPEELELSPGSGEMLDPKLILFVDEQLLVVNKPAGLVVHPARGHWNDTLVQQLLPWLDNPRHADPGGLRPGIVHRLDKDTTGCLLVARSPEIRERMSRAIERREVDRWYLGIAEGNMRPAGGTVEAPIGRDPRHRLRMAVTLRGRPARTHYATVAAWQRYSLLLMKLDTGRTHQIRVHLASIGHPLLGDLLYGGHDLGSAKTQVLHAWQLRFFHPIRATEMVVRAPLPDDWRNLWTVLGPPESVLEPMETETGPWPPGIGKTLRASLPEEWTNGSV
jgi:23S rRNA pseudouridine1911/1915/1917 synthase